MKIYKIIAIFKKTLIDMLRNKRVFLFFLMFPAMTYLFCNIMPEEAVDQFPMMFLPMHILFASMSVISGLIAEEKEKGTLKSLMFANIKPAEYFVGTGLFVLVATLITSSLFLPLIKFNGLGIINIFISIILCSICSMILGAVIGILSNNEMTANGIGAPITIFLGMMPMISMVNETFEKISSLLYTTRFSKTIIDNNNVIGFESWLVYLVNFVICLLIFAYVYKKKKINV